MFKAIPMFSGSSGNSTYIKSGNDEILIDAGVSYKNIRLALERLETDISNIKAIFVTHEHSDHIKGLEVLAKNNPDIPIYINGNSLEEMSNLGYVYALNSACVKNPGDEVSIGSFHAFIFDTPHDSNGSVGYRFESTYGDTLGYATDIGNITQKIQDALLGCQSVVIESNHDISMLKSGPYPYILKKRILSDHGHLSNDACAEFLPELVDHGTKKIVLAHLSHENNTPDIAYRTSASHLTDAGFTPEDVKLTVAMRSIL